MPRPAAGVPGKGMSRRRHRTAERQPGAGNSHIEPYVRRDAEASQVTVPAPLLRQGFLREDSGPLERMPESGRPGARSQSISRPAGLRRVGQTASTIVGAVVFLSGCGLSCRPGRRRGGQRTTAESHRPTAKGHPHRPGHRPGGENRGRKRKTQGGRRDRKADAGFHTGRDIGRARKTEGENGRHKAGGGTEKRMRVFTQVEKQQAERAAGRETGKGPKRGWEPGRNGKIRPAGQMLRPIRQPCARKGEKQPAGRRMRFSLYRFVL